MKNTARGMADGDGPSLIMRRKTAFVGGIQLCPLDERWISKRSLYRCDGYRAAWDSGESPQRRPFRPDLMAERLVSYPVMNI